MSRHIGVAVFDFDCTLSTEQVGHWHGYSNMLDGFGGAHRVAEIVSMLNQLRASGVAIAIVSYNSKAIIRKGLGIVGLAEFFNPELIFGCEVWEAQEMQGGRKPRWSKAGVIRDFIMAPLSAVSADILFVDDDSSHCQEVANALLGASVIEVQGMAGLRGVQMEAICRWAMELASGGTRDVLGPIRESPPLSVDIATSTSLTASAHAFVPKRSSGPLSRHCAQCNAHVSVHA